MGIENDAFDRIPGPQAVPRRTLVRDAALLASVPVVLALVFALPAPVRRSFAFEYRDPSLLTAYAAPFVHLTSSHLLSNVVGYCILVPVAYALSVLSGGREQFYAVFVTFVLVFPPVLSYLNLAVLRASASVGFSGVLLAFLGYLPVVIARDLDAQFDIGPGRFLSPALFFVGTALVAVLSLRSVLFSNPTVLLGTSLLVVAILLSAVLFLLATVDSAESSWSGLRGVVAAPGHSEVLSAAGVLFVGFPFVAFPPDPTAAAGVVNLYVHLLGYAMGFMVTYSTAEVTARLPDVALVR